MCEWQEPLFAALQIRQGDRFLVLLLPLLKSDTFCCAARRDGVQHPRYYDAVERLLGELSVTVERSAAGRTACRCLLCRAGTKGQAADLPCSCRQAHEGGGRLDPSRQLRAGLQ